MSYVFFGGMRGTAWVNAFQTVLFLCFGAIALIVIGRHGRVSGAVMQGLLADPATAPLLTRERISPLFFFSYTFIPLSTITFPHIAIFCLTAKRMVQFKKTVIFYPICILAIWLPAYFWASRRTRSPIGAADHGQARGAAGARRERAPTCRQPTAPRCAARRRETTSFCSCSNRYAPLWLAGLLGAGIMAAVMASDSQILALSTMFAEDVFAFYGGPERFGEAAQVQMGRAVRRRGDHRRVRHRH